MLSLVGIADQLHFNWKRYEPHPALRSKHSALVLDAQRQACAIGERQPVLLRFRKQFSACGSECLVKRHNLNRIAVQERRDGTRRLTAFDGLLKYLGVIDSGDKRAWNRAEHYVCSGL